MLPPQRTADVHTCRSTTKKERISCGVKAELMRSRLGQMRVQLRRRNRGGREMFSKLPRCGSFACDGVRVEQDALAPDDAPLGAKPGGEVIVLSAALDLPVVDRSADPHPDADGTPDVCSAAIVQRVILDPHDIDCVADPDPGEHATGDPDSGTSVCPASTCNGSVACIEASCKPFLEREDRAALAASAILERLRARLVTGPPCPAPVHVQNMSKQRNDVKAGNRADFTSDGDSGVPEDTDNEQTSFSDGNGAIAEVGEDVTQDRRSQETSGDVVKVRACVCETSVDTDALHYNANFITGPAAEANDGYDVEGTAVNEEVVRVDSVELQNSVGANCAAYLGKEDRAAAAASALLARLFKVQHVGRSAVIQHALRASKVRFDIDTTVVHEITPYSEVYGMHPRHFVFDKSSRMVAAARGGFVSLQSLQEQDDEFESDEAETEDDTEGEAAIRLLS